MASYVPLYACVVFFVSFGSVLCAGGGGDASSSSNHWMSGLKMTEVTLIKPFWYNKELPHGLVQAKLHDIDGTDMWCWEYYESGDWIDVDGGKIRDPKDCYERFIEDGIRIKECNGKKVTFKYQPKGARLSNEYVFVFATKNDADKFIGSADGQKSKISKLFSSCV